MGLWSTIKGWLNIGGVKVKLDGVDPQIYVGMGMITGKVILTAKEEKQVLSLTCKVVHDVTTKDRDDEEETESTTLGIQEFLEPFTLKAEETREIEFEFACHLKEQLEHMGGVAGAMGKLGSFASGKKQEFYLLAECDVKGTVLDPSDRVDLKVTKHDLG